MKQAPTVSNDSNSDDPRSPIVNAVGTAAQPLNPDAAEFMPAGQAQTLDDAVVHADLSTECQGRGTALVCDNIQLGAPADDTATMEVSVSGSESQQMSPPVGPPPDAATSSAWSNIELVLIALGKKRRGAMPAQYKKVLEAHRSQDAGHHHRILIPYNRELMAAVTSSDLASAFEQAILRLASREAPGTDNTWLLAKSKALAHTEVEHMIGFAESSILASSGESEQAAAQAMNTETGETEAFQLAPILQRGMTGTSSKAKRSHGTQKHAGGSAHSKSHPLPKGSDGKYKTTR